MWSCQKKPNPATKIGCSEALAVQNALAKNAKGRVGDHAGAHGHHSAWSRCLEGGNERDEQEVRWSWEWGADTGALEWHSKSCEQVPNIIKHHPNIPNMTANHCINRSLHSKVGLQSSSRCSQNLGRRQVCLSQNANEPEMVYNLFQLDTTWYNTLWYVIIWCSMIEYDRLWYDMM